MTAAHPKSAGSLLPGGGDVVQLAAARVSVTDLSAQADGQRYDFVSADHDQRVIRYEAVDGTFTADIRVQSSARPVVRVSSPVKSAVCADRGAWRLACRSVGVAMR